MAYETTYTADQMRELSASLDALLGMGVLSDRDEKLAQSMKEKFGRMVHSMERAGRTGGVIVPMTEDEYMFMQGIHEAVWRQG